MFGNGVVVPIIHEALEGGWGVAEAEHHDLRLVEASSCFKGCLMRVCLFDLNVIVPLAHIKLGIYSRAS